MGTTSWGRAYVAQVTGNGIYTMLKSLERKLTRILKKQLYYKRTIKPRVEVGELFHIAV